MRLTSPIRSEYITRRQASYMTPAMWSRLRNAHGSVLVGRFQLYPRWRCLWALHDWFCFRRHHDAPNPEEA